MRTSQHPPSPGPAARRRMIAPPASTRFDAVHVDAVGRLARGLLERATPSSSSEVASAREQARRSG